MPLIYITGAPGVGKSTIQQALKAEGYEAHDIDDPMWGGAYNKQADERVAIPPAELRDPAWFDTHEWRTDLDALKQLKERAKNQQVFVCGVTPNDEPILPLFDKVYYLQLDEEALKQRLNARVGNDYGKNDFELTEILKRKKRLDELHDLNKSEMVDATQAPSEIVAMVAD